MSLKCRNDQQTSLMPGVFVNEVTVKDVQDISGTTPAWYTKQVPVDLGLELTLDIGRDGFYPKMTICGNFKRDGDNVDWGSAFPVRDFLNAMGYEGDLDENNTIPLPVLNSIPGQKFQRLQYVSGRNKKDAKKFHYSDWSTVGRAGEPFTKLVDRFKKSVAKGYPKNYRPELVDGSTEAIPAETISDDAASILND